MRSKLYGAFRLQNPAQTSRRGALLQQLPCLAIASETEKLQFHNAILLSGFLQHWRGDVVNGNARRCFPLQNAVVCVTVEHCGRAESIYRFFQTTRTEEGINFRIFAFQCRSNRRVMQDHYPALSLQLDQSLLEANSVAN